MSITIFQNNRFSYIVVRAGRMGGWERPPPAHAGRQWVGGLKSQRTMDSVKCLFAFDNPWRLALLLEDSLPYRHRPTFHPWSLVTLPFCCCWFWDKILVSGPDWPEIPFCTPGWPQTCGDPPASSVQTLWLPALGLWKSTDIQFQGNSISQTTLHHEEHTELSWETEQSLNWALGSYVDLFLGFNFITAKCYCYLDQMLQNKTCQDGVEFDAYWENVRQRIEINKGAIEMSGRKLLVFFFW